MSYKNLRVGVVLNELSPRILVCMDGTFRFDKLGQCNKFKENDVVLFEDSESDEVCFAIGLDEFHYYSHLGHHNEDYYDYTIRKQTGVCVPKECINKNDKFIIDNGYGYQFVVYCKFDDTLYVDWRYTHAESDLIRFHFVKNETKTPQNIIEETNNYLESLDINELLESFTISIHNTYISRPGKEDSCYVNKRSKVFDDGYINSLFPSINEDLYSERGFCSAYSMGWHGEKRPYKEDELRFIEKAKSNYNKECHRTYLLNERFDSLLRDQRSLHEKTIELRLSCIKEIINLLRNDKVYIDYATDLNRILRLYYRKAHNGEEIDWHNFYDKITR